MEPTDAPDSLVDLRRLVAGFRVQLEARARSGAVGVQRAATPRLAAPARTGPSQEERTLPVSSPLPATLPSPRGLGAEAFAGGCATDSEAPHEVPPGAVGLTLVRQELGDCQRCRLSATRKTLVYGVGNPSADLVFVGEAPGADEDEQGEPFVGKAGQLLTKMIEAMGFTRDAVYICNVIKCRPPGNRNPEPDEVERCEPFLKKQLAALRPRLLVALGKFAAQSLCKEQTPITRLRGNWRSYEGIQVMPTFHPAYLLRNPAAKREAWADLQQVMATLRRMGVEPPFPKP